MVKSHYIAGIVGGLLMVSCAPKAVVIQETPIAPKQEVAKIPEPLTPAIDQNATVAPDDGLRIPNMLELPGEGEFRSTSAPGTKAETGSGAVISRPPTDPPVRVKPKEEAAADQR